jgi:hypothetical protein
MINENLGQMLSFAFPLFSKYDPEEIISAHLDTAAPKDQQF